MYFLGLDLGQKVDPSAAVLVERIDHRQAFMGSAFEKLVVRYVDRMPLGMPYPAVVDRVRAIVRSPSVAGQCLVAVDAGGVGAPVMDLLRSGGLGCGVKGYTITGGERSSGESVTKRDLLSCVQVLLETGRLAIGKVKEKQRLIRELTDVRATVNGSGRMRMGADGYGEHDDLVIALALACWRVAGRGKVGRVGEQSERLL